MQRVWAILSFVICPVLSRFSEKKINLLKTKRNLLYIRNQCVPRSKHFIQRLYKPISQCCLKQKSPSVLISVQNTQRKASAMYNFGMLKTWWYVKKPLVFKRLMNLKFWIYLQLLSKTCFIQSIIKLVRVKYSLHLSDFNATWTSPINFRNIIKCKISWNSAQCETIFFFGADERMGERKDRYTWRGQYPLLEILLKRLRGASS